MLSIETRCLTAAERAELTAERARRTAERAREREASRATSRGAILSVLGIAGLFGAIAAFNVYAGHLDTAAIAGAGMAGFVGVAVWLRTLDRRAPRPDDPAVARIDAALARDEVRLLELKADAAVSVREDGDGEAMIVGDLLRCGAGQVVHLRRSQCGDVDPELLPNGYLRIACVPGLGIRRVEALGPRLEPLAVVEDLAEVLYLPGETQVIVCAPAEGRCDVLELADASLEPLEAIAEVGGLADALLRT